MKGGDDMPRGRKKYFPKPKERELQVYSAGELAAILGLTRHTLYGWIRRGLIPRPRSRPMRWNREQVENIVKRLTEY
ncbi:MAG: helix-turn-helix domain-containing protein [Candidatus Methanomethylicaceae archaeon]